MLIPGLYGYVSACKWLTRIEATTYDAFDAYWIKRDWAAEGPIRDCLAHRHPRAAAADFPTGRRAITGHGLGADARHRPRPRSRLDDEDWVAAGSPRTSTPTCGASGCPPTTSPSARTRSPSAPQAPRVRSRPRRVSPFPNGSSGWHSIQVVAA